MGRKWRNNWDPTRYWVCEAENVAATEVICETALGFLDAAQACVEWTSWDWTAPCDPPSGSDNGGGGPGPSNGCDYNHGNGRPACTAEEMGRNWRNNWDPTRYWVCESLNAPATEVVCDTALGFSDAAQTCVEWTEWKWTFPCNPPSA
jgi:hypothetical protein